MAIAKLALILLQKEGLVEHGWKFNTPFWWPVLVVQSNAKLTAFTDKVIEATRDDFSDDEPEDE